MGRIIARMTGLRGMFYGLSMAYATLISFLLLVFRWSGTPVTLSEAVLALALIVGVASTIGGVISLQAKWYIAWGACVVGCFAVAYIIHKEFVASARGFDVGRHSILFLAAIALVALPTLGRQR